MQCGTQPYRLTESRVSEGRAAFALDPEALNLLYFLLGPGPPRLNTHHPSHGSILSPPCHGMLLGERSLHRRRETRFGCLVEKLSEDILVI